MSFTDAVTRVSQIQAQIASLQTAFDPSVAGTAATQTTTAAGSAVSGQLRRRAGPGAGHPSGRRPGHLRHGRRVASDRRPEPADLRPAAVRLAPGGADGTRSLGHLGLAAGRGVRRRRPVAPGSEQQRLAQHRLHRQRHLRIGRLGLEQPDHRGRRHRRLAQRSEHDPRLRHRQLGHSGHRRHRRAAGLGPDRRPAELWLGLERLSEPPLALPATRGLISRSVAG